MYINVKFYREYMIKLTQDTLEKHKQRCLGSTEKYIDTQLSYLSYFSEEDSEIAR